MLRNCILLSKIKNVSECRWLSACPRLFNKDIGSDGNDPADKLNALLLSLGKEDKTTPSDALKVQVAKPRSKQRLKKADKVADVKKNLGSRIVDAAKDVANKLEGDKKEIEAQLLHKLLYKDSQVKTEILKASSGNQTLTELLTKMDVEREEKIPPTTQVSTDDFSRAAQVKKLIGRRSVKDKFVPRREQRVALFGEKPLGIFDAKVCKDRGIQLKTWNACEERERKLSVTHPPSNYFEQMIDWTEKGVVWKFPINNEQGLEAEKNVSFASHVLLESHLDGWCPTAGPIRHFLELVCVGLSRNHWLSAAEKEAHLLWYKEFFTERRKLIKELGAGEIPEVSDANVSA